MDLQQLLGALRRRWKIVIAVFVLCVVAAAAYSFASTPVYESKAKIYLQPTSEQVDARYQTTYYSSARMPTYTELANDPEILGSVKEKLKLDKSVDELADDISATTITGAPDMTLEVRNEDPLTAQEISIELTDQLTSVITDLETPEKSRENRTPTAPIEAIVSGQPSYSDSPVSPNTKLNLGIGALLGLILGITLAALRDTADKKIRSTDELEDITGAQMMAVIPRDRSFEAHPLITDADAPIARAEPYRVLRTNLNFSGDRDNVILVTSSVPNEGKTTTAANLGLAMAQSDKRSLIIDCDLRNPNVAKLLGMKLRSGLTSVLRGDAYLEDAIQHHDSGLDVLATGPKPLNPAELLESQVFVDLLEYLNEIYDVVVLDAPPLLPVTDPAIVAGRIRSALLVVRHDSTTRDQLNGAVNRLRTVGADVRGVVLSMYHHHAGDGYGYDYGYGYGYGYGEEAAHKAKKGLRKLGVPIG